MLYILYIYIEWKKDIYTDIHVYILRHKQRRAGQRRPHRVTAGEEKKKQLKKNEIKRSSTRTRTRTSRKREQEQLNGTKTSPSKALQWQRVAVKVSLERHFGAFS